MYNVPFTMSELHSALALYRDIAAGPDGLSYSFLHHLYPTAMEFLLSFLNLVYKSKLFPDLCHQSIVIPIPNPDKDNFLPGNFFPISLTSCLCKLLEHLVKVLEDIQGLSPLQFGFH